MAFTLEPLQPSDASPCVDIVFAAFQSPYSLACWPRDNPGVRQWWKQMIHDELTEPGAHWFKAVSKQTGEIAGFVKWQEPKPGQAPETHLPEWPSGADNRLLDETFGAAARGHRDLMGTRGHWCLVLTASADLEILATSPSFQGQGAATQMIQWGLARADAQSAETYLEASANAVHLYEKHGFREADRIDTWVENERVKRTLYRNSLMIRQPAQTGEGIREEKLDD